MSACGANSPSIPPRGTVIFDQKRTPTRALSPHPELRPACLAEQVLRGERRRGFMVFASDDRRQRNRLLGHLSISIVATKKGDPDCPAVPVATHKRSWQHALSRRTVCPLTARRS